MAPRGGMDVGLEGAGLKRARRADRPFPTNLLTVVVALLAFLVVSLNAAVTGLVMEPSFMVVPFVC